MPDEIAITLPTLNLVDLEELAVGMALEKCAGNRTQAAKVLGIDVRTLQRKVKLYGLPALPASTCRSSRN